MNVEHKCLIDLMTANHVPALVNYFMENKTENFKKVTKQPKKVTTVTATVIVLRSLWRND